jgi:hypothetical protein
LRGPANAQALVEAIAADAIEDLIEFDSHGDMRPV